MGQNMFMVKKFILETKKLVKKSVGRQENRKIKKICALYLCVIFCLFVEIYIVSI